MTNPELPRLLQAIYKVPAAKEPRNDLVGVYLKGVKGLNQPPRVRPAEELRLNTSIPPSADPKRLGVLDGDNAGFPNGRRLTDDVVDVSMQAAAGELVGNKNDLGDAVDKNDRKFGSTFPYLALPETGSRGPLAGVKGSDVSKQDDVGSSLGGGVSTVGSSDDSRTTLIAASAAAGAAGVLLTGTGLLWWRNRRRNPVV